jgi:amidase
MTGFIDTFTLGGPGPTIAIKDTIDIAGYPTRAASRALADAPEATSHADVVQLLLASGWEIAGKANMHELAFGMTGINDYTGTPLNPQDASRIPGGSSSGSASLVGFGTVDAALGTDTGGSIRGPAACCGVLGLKPTFGRVSRRGVAPAHSTLDCVGPFARDIDTLVDVMTAIAPGFNQSLARQASPKCRIAQIRVPADTAINTALEAALRQVDCHTYKIDLDDLEAAFHAGLTIINVETSRAFGHLLESGQLGADLQARLRIAGTTTLESLASAEQVRARLIKNIDRALDEADVLVLPTLPALPITVEEARKGVSVIAMSSLIRPFNLSGHPAISIPLPLPGNPLKAGLQIVGRRWADEQVCAVAARFEAAFAN